MEVNVMLLDSLVRAYFDTYRVKPHYLPCLPEDRVEDKIWDCCIPNQSSFRLHPDLFEVGLWEEVTTNVSM